MVARRYRGGVAIAVAIMITAAACGTGKSSGGSGSYNAATTSVVNSSTHRGGTLTLDIAQDWDSPDPGNTYYNWSWDFSRLYARPLIGYANEPGSGGLKLVPDLAASLGTPSDGGRTWTYRLRRGVRYSNGQEVTSADVKYAVERSNWGQSILTNGPSYFFQLIEPNPAKPWPGPYTDKGGSLPSSEISTPDPYTIVFHLQKPFADFNYVAALSDTAPVPQKDDTGASYQNHILSTGPYRIDSYRPGVGMALSRNPYWSAATDPGHLHPQLVNEIKVAVKVDANTVDQRLLSGEADLDLLGQGVQAQSQARILTNPKLRANADDAATGYLDYLAVNTRVQPFTNINCREAVEYGVNKVEVQDQYGGPTAGAIASTILPPTVTGYAPYSNPFATAGNTGDLAKARQYLARCQQQLGSRFTRQVNISARSDRPKELAAASALESELRQVGFSPTIVEYPSSDYFSTFAGSPSYAQQHQLGLMMMAIAADWPDGYSFLYLTVDGQSIRPANNFNLSEINDPEINGLITSAGQNLDDHQRVAAWSRVDQLAMRQAVIVPLLYAKALMYRPSNVTNVMVDEALGMYNYSTLGLSR